MFYLSRTGTTEGPFTEAVIVDMIKSRLAESGHVCPVGGQEWVLLNAHPAFAAAFQERERRESARPPAPSVAGAPATMAPLLTPAAAAAPVTAATMPSASFAPATQAGPSASFAPVPQAQAPSMGPRPPQQSQPPMGPQSFGPQAPQSFGPGAPHQAAPMGSAHPSHPSHSPLPPNVGPNSYAPQASWSPTPPPAGSFAPNGYGPQPSGSFAGAMSIPPKEKSNVAVIVAGVLGALLVVGGGVAAAAYFFFFSATPLAGYFPEDTQVYAEVGSIKRSALGVASLSIVDASKLDEKKMLEDTKAGIAKAFDLSPDDATRVALGMSGLAIGGRDVDGKGKVAASLVLAFDDTKSAETLLKSARFSEMADAGKSGKRYSLKRREMTPEQKKSAGMVEQALSDLQLTSDKTDQLVWFPKKKVLVIADSKTLDETFAAIESGNNTLLKSKAFAANKSRFGGPGLVGYVEPSLVLKSDKGQDVKKYFQDTSPIIVSLVPEKPGIRMTLSGELAGFEDDLTRLESSLSPSGLTLSKKLPKETIAYLGFSSKTKLSGKEVRDAFFKGLNKEKATGGLQKSIEEGEGALGTDLSTVFDAIGDEGAIAAVARSGYRYQKGQTPTFDDFAVVYAQKIRDAAAAKKLVGTLKEKAAKSPFKLTAKGDDVVAEADKPFPRVEIRFVDGSLVVVAGSKELADRTYAAMGGSGTLADDKAHAMAIDKLDAKHLLLWVDLGRVGDNALSAQPEVKTMASSLGFDVDALILTGDRRVSGALGMTLSKKGDKLGYVIDSMNLPIAAATAGAFAPSALLRKKDSFTDAKDAKDPFDVKEPRDGKKLGLTTTTSATTGTTGASPASASLTVTTGTDLPAICETALTRYDRCVYKVVAAQHRGRMIKALRDGMTKQQTNESRPRYCQALIDAAERSHPGCQ